MPEISPDYAGRIQRLLEVCTNLVSNLDLEPFLQSIIETAAALTQSESSTILEYDRDHDVLRYLAAPFYILKSLKAMTVSLDGSVAGWVYTNRQPIAINNVKKDKRIHRILERSLDEDLHSILSVPLLFKGEPIGVLEVFNKLYKASYTDEDIRSLETLASQAAVAIQNHRLLQEARDAYRKVMELNRLKSDFIAIASHELRTPLGLVLGHATFLGEIVDPAQKREVDIIIRNSMQLKEILEQLSNLDQLELGATRLRRKRFSVSKLVAQICDQFKELAQERQIYITVDLPKSQLFVEGDEGRLAIALRNIVKNAMIFTNDHGKIRVRAEEVPGYVKISVIDNGIGIPEADIEKIFDRFYQVEKHLTRQHSGLGLGLSIAREMVLMHGGRIWVESIEGKGSRFSFLIPQNAAQANAAQRVFKT